MEGQTQLRRWYPLGIALLTASCGGGTEVQQPGAQAAGAALPAGPSDASSFVVPVSMVVPKKQAAPPVSTTTTTTTATNRPAGMGFPAMAPAGAAPAGAVPGAAPAGAAPAGAAPAAAPTPGAGAAGAPAATSGMTAAAGGAAMAPAGANITGVPDAELEVLRTICVDEINMYRATLSLPPMKRANPKQEACSDQGAKKDGDTKIAHGAAREGLCSSVGLYAENTCPGWPVGGGAFSQFATIGDALKGCLKSMWAEGEPPEGRDACMKDVSGCFQDHGHYLNMSGSSGSVACSFYKMMDGRSYWMNQDFGR